MLNIEVIKFEAQDVITTSVAAPTEAPTEEPIAPPAPPAENPRCACDINNCMNKYGAEWNHQWSPSWGVMEQCNGVNGGQHTCEYN